MILKNNKGNAPLFQFIARNPAAMLIAGGILFILIQEAFTGWVMVLIGVVLHLVYLRGRFF